MSDWKIENTNAPVVYSGPNEITASVAGKRTDPDKPVYWIAPQKYTGRQVSHV